MSQEPKLRVVTDLSAVRAQKINWEKVVNLYIAGTSVSELARQCACERNTIYNNLRKLGVIPDRKADIKDVAATKLQERSVQDPAQSTPSVGNKTGMGAAIAQALERPGADDEKVVLAEADRIVNVQADHRTMLSRGRQAINLMLDRFVEAGCTKVVFDPFGQPIVVSASAEIKNLTACISKLVPLERQAHGLADAGEPDDKAKAAAVAAKKLALEGIDEILNRLKAAKDIAANPAKRHERQVG